MSYEQQVIADLEAYLRSVRAKVVASSGTVSVEYKEDRSIVTELDLEIEREATKIILSHGKGIGIVGEEYGVRGDEQTFWTLDPIDGTEHFMRGTPEYMFMAGFVKDNVPTASIMYNFELDQMFVALPGQQAKMNGKSISVSNRDMDRACVEPEMREGKLPRFLEMAEAIPLGYQIPYWHAGYGFSLVASGKLEARIQLEPYGKLYDFLPGSILIKSAGGEVVNIGSDSWDWRNLDTIASNGVITKDLQEVLHEFRQTE